LLGAGGVGKSAITYRMVRKGYEPEYDPSTQDVYACEVSIDERDAYFALLDPKGDERTCLIMDDWLFDADGFLLMYSVDKKSSFEKLKALYNDIEKDKQANFNLIVIGNKSDIPADKREVTTEEGKTYADELKCSFYECSAKEEINTKEIFTELGRMIRKSTGDKPQKKVVPNNQAQPQVQPQVQPQPQAQEKTNDSGGGGDQPKVEKTVA